MKLTLCISLCVAMVIADTSDLEEVNVERFEKRSSEDLDTSKRDYQPQCHLSTGQVLRYGEIKEFGCNVYRCEADRLNKIRTGCQTRDGQCSRVGEDRTEGCYVVRCQDTGYFTVQSEGCSSNGGCRRVGESWRDDCDTVTCKKTQNGYTVMYQKVRQASGCYIDGRCYREGESFRHPANCGTYRCEGRTTGGYYYPSGRLVRAECKDSSGQCYTHGQRWSTDGGCMTNSCRVNGHSYQIERRWDSRRCRSSGYSAMSSMEAAPVVVPEVADIAEQSTGEGDDEGA